MKKWLFLRGSWDCRTKKSLDDNDDMWLELFREIAGNNSYDIYFKDAKDQQYSNLEDDYEHIFSRGGFPWQSEILERYPRSFKIYYGAGRRYMPQDDIEYNLVLVDSPRQKEDIEAINDRLNVETFFKPAASCFKPHDVDKEYDICFIANGQQAHFKGVEFVYKNCPRDLKVLHLGYINDKFYAPDNVTRKRVDRKDMAKEISKCKVGIVPYFNKIDSGPRIIPEMLACDIPLMIADELNFSLPRTQNFWIPTFLITEKLTFFEDVKFLINRVENNKVYKQKWVSEYYKDNLSIKTSSKLIKALTLQYIEI